MPPTASRVRLKIRNKPGMLGRVTSAIGKAGGDIGAVDLVEMSGERGLRDITIKARDSRHAHDINQINNVLCFPGFFRGLCSTPEPAS